MVFNLWDIIEKIYCKWLGNLYKGRFWEGLVDLFNYIVMCLECLVLGLKVVRKVWYRYICIILLKLYCKILKSWVFILINLF